MGNAAASVRETITSRKAVVRLLRHRRKQENLLSFGTVRDRRRKFDVRDTEIIDSPFLFLPLSLFPSALLKISE